MSAGLALTGGRPAADGRAPASTRSGPRCWLGFIVSGIGVGLLNPVIADVALSVVPKERSGMAAGINDTFRQVGIAVGIAAWGAIFLGAGAAKVAGRGRRRPSAAATSPRQLVEATSSGALPQALAAVPRGRAR